jgi:hypothetical protein
VQDSPDWQRFVHVPQWSWSLVKFTQPAVGPQSDVPAGQTHCPELHVPRPQRRPQAPQLFGSLETCVQPIAPQLTWPVPHTHCPDWHMPEPHESVQLPQCCGSLEGSMQPIAEPQKVLVPEHAHIPEVQCPLPQLLPHCPQLDASVDRSAQAPVATHSVVPVGHAPHCPEVQA